MDLDMFPDGVLIAGSDQRVEYVNSRIRGMARAGETEMIGMHISEAMPFDDLNGNSWYDCNRPYDGLATRNRISEQSWYSPRGSEYLITARLVRDRPAGSVERVVVDVRNARQRHAKDRERSDLVATVAHELRSPLTGIKGFSSTLLTKWDKFTEEQRQLMLETVDADADRLTRLITELLDAARIDANRLTLRQGPVRVDDILRHVLRTMVAAGHGDSYELDIEASLQTVWGDADRITQVITNLVENAMRHGHGIKHIEVADCRFGDRPRDTTSDDDTSGHDISPDVAAKLKKLKQGRPDDQQSGVSLTIHDRGPGIPSEVRQRVFSRFWRSGPGAGSGLGMYIVHGIVTQHGGAIEIADSPGGGALVSVWLPINEPEALSD